MPTVVTAWGGVGKPNRKGAEAGARQPAALPYELIEGLVKLRRVGSLPKRVLRVVAQTDNRPGPGLWVMGIAPGVAPKQFAALVRQAPGEGMVEADEAILDKVSDLRFVQRVWHRGVSGENGAAQIMRVAVDQRRRQVFAGIEQGVGA